MDKNENGSTAQFSPEELIRRLKSQLNINTEQEEQPVKEDNEEIENPQAEELPNEAEGVELSAEAPENTEVEAVVEETVSADPQAAVDEPEQETADESPVGADSTVEFSISDLFGNSEPTEESVKEIDTETYDNENGQKDDDFDFLSFLAASGISADKTVKAGADDEADTEPSEEITLSIEDIAAESEPTPQTNEPVSENFERITIDEELVTDTVFEDEQPLEEPALNALDENNSENAEFFETRTELSPSDGSVEESPVDVISKDEDAVSESSVASVDISENDELDYSFGAEPAADAESATESKALPDFNMLIALGIPVAEVEKIYGSEAAEEYTKLTEGTGALDDLSDDEEEYEYTSRSQNDEIEAHYKSEKKLTFVKLCAAAILFVIALLFENLPALGAEYSGWMDQSAFPVVHIMVDLQLVLFAAVLAWDELESGVKALLRRSANVGTLIAAAVLINVICDVALCFTRVAKYEVKPAGASVIFAILMCLGISALRLFAEIKAFAAISQKGVRSCVLTDSADDARERNVFFDKISKEDASSSKIISFGKTKFVSGFFANQTSDRATVVDKILAPAAIVGAIVAFVIAYAVSKSVGIGLYTLNCASAFLLPVSVFAAGTVTYAKAASYAESMKAAIIGENAPYDLADSSVVAFEDRDAYPSYCVKLRNLKVYGNIAIVDVLRMTTTAFRRIGGPLSDVLESATSELNKDVPVDIVKSCESGVEAVYQGQRLLIGKSDFLHSYGIIPYSDVDDREYLKTGDVSIMYVAYGEELAAKFYVQYTLDVDFEVLLRDLNRAGICVSIRTSDPNIDKRLLQAKLNLNKTSLRIVYREPSEGLAEPTEETNSAVIGTGTPSELIHTAMLCDRVVHVYRTNTIVKAISLVVGLALLLLFALISVNVNVFSGLLVIYQLFWMIPTLIVSKLFL